MPGTRTVRATVGNAALCVGRLQQTMSESTFPEYYASMSI